MSAWINADIYFDDNAATFTLSHGDPEFRVLVEAMRDFKDEPSLLCAVVRSLLLERRPELVGCSIFYLGFCDASYRLKIGVIHESLPARKPGAHSEEISLDHKPNSPV